ncbi:MAG: metal-dependent hydrolase [Nocardiopsaceae bacterium]|nr:metal-dependent hydrolase [Nocardiopsaceae bacterium]
MLGRDHALTGAVVFAALAPTLHMPVSDLPAGVVLAAGAGVLPDIDHHDSTIASSFGFLTEGFSRVINAISGGHRHGTHSLIGVAIFTAGAWASGALQQHAHGGLTVGSFGSGALSWYMIPALVYLTLLYSSALRALRVGGHHGDLIGVAGAAVTCYLGTDVVPVTVWHWRVPFLAVAIALGCVAHIAGDELTHSGCPVLWPVSRHEFHLLPKPMRITTAKLTENRIIFPVLVILLAVAVWHAAGQSITLGPAHPGAGHTGAGHGASGTGASLGSRNAP